MRGEEDRDRRMQEYDRKRREAIRAIETINPRDRVLPLAEVVALMPDHPEWVEYTRNRRKR